MEKRKVVLVGTGFVGMSFAYSLFNQGGANELVLIDVLKRKSTRRSFRLSTWNSLCSIKNGNKIW